MSKETISFRKDKLKGILKNKKITNSEKEVIKGYYKKYYVPAENKEKRSIKDIEIKDNKFNSNCFSFIFDDGLAENIAIRYLTGEKINDASYKNKSMRNAIQNQIRDFIANNPKANDGNVYEVGHEPDFFEIQKEFLDIYNNGQDPVPDNTIDLKNNILPNNLTTLWREFHKEKATLKWITKEKNRLHKKSWENQKRKNKSESGDSVIKKKKSS